MWLPLSRHRVHAKDSTGGPDSVAVAMAPSTTDGGALQTPTVSFEFFPPKDQAGQETLWRTVAQLSRISPAFVCVTYGAGGGTQDRTLQTAARMVDELKVPTIGHLTLVGATRERLRDVLAQYQAIGLHGVLALRGDPVAAARDARNRRDGTDGEGPDRVLVL